MKSSIISLFNFDNGDVCFAKIQTALDAEYATSGHTQKSNRESYSEWLQLYSDTKRQECSYAKNIAEAKRVLYRPQTIRKTFKSSKFDKNNLKAS